uniref:Probable DNA-directed RNA polymerase II subunit RPB11 n=1 Tax=Trichuris muris TaxID=70415 RepID=A0A5S6QI70_TRIMR
MNAPPSFESFLLFDGEKKISAQKETKVPNAYLFIINKEDHTMGNLLKDKLLEDGKVLFAGYKQPHPLEHKIYLRVQTTPDYHPLRALNTAFLELISEVNQLEEDFREAIKERLANAP